MLVPVISFDRWPVSYGACRRHWGQESDILPRCGTKVPLTNGYCKGGNGFHQWHDNCTSSFVGFTPARVGWLFTFVCLNTNYPTFQSHVANLLLLPIVTYPGSQPPGSFWSRADRSLCLKSQLLSLEPFRTPLLALWAACLNGNFRS